MLRYGRRREKGGEDIGISFERGEKGLKGSKGRKGTNAFIYERGIKGVKGRFRAP